MSLFERSLHQLNWKFKIGNSGKSGTASAPSVPYIYCTNLVSERKVRLRNGYANAICDQWKALILSLFQTFLTISIAEMKHNRTTHAALNDHRVKSILSTIFGYENPYTYSRLQDFNKEITFFPLCMQNLHNVLQKHHRLPHEERYNYSLFLKDIGMSLEDSLMFWKTEYSKESTSCGKCCHSWQKDDRRYIYSIRHLYGLEGSRKNYRSRSCHYFQKNIMTATQEGGCPFIHFDNENLKRLLRGNLNVDEEGVDTILSEREKGATNACRVFMHISFNKINSTNESESATSGPHFNSPVQYFHVIKDLK